MQDLVKAYNASPHRSLGGKLAPKDVNIRNLRLLWEIQKGLYPQKITQINPRLPRLKHDDYVRLSKAKKVFDKGNLPNWTEEVFQVSDIIRKFKPIQYKVKDYNGEVVDGSFYRAELQKIDKPISYMIEAILGSRRRAGNTEYLIKWHGYGAQFNSWQILDKQTVKHIQKRR